MLPHGNNPDNEEGLRANPTPSLASWLEEDYSESTLLPPDTEKESLYTELTLRFLALTKFGYCLEKRQQHEEAMEYFREALRLKRPSIFLEPKEIQKVFAALLYKIGMLQIQHGEDLIQVRRSKALYSFRLCLILRRSALAANHPAVASTLHNIGVILLEDGQSYESLECFQEALKIRYQAHGPTHIEIGTTMHHIGRAYQARGEYCNALQMYGEGISVFEALTYSNASIQEQTVQILIRVGQSWHALGHCDEALASYQQASHLVARLRQTIREQGSAEVLSIPTMEVLSITESPFDHPGHAPAA